MAATHDKEYLEEFDAEHRLDPNLPEDVLQRVEGALGGKYDEKTDFDQRSELVHELEEDSPYPEVRSAVSPTDDPTMPANTFRMWFLGIIFTIAGSGINQFFSLRYPGVTISMLAALLVSYPCGMFMAKVLPRGFLNPGPFSIKEHTLICVMANVSFGSAYATDILVTQIHFYGRDFGWGYSLLLTITSQVIGYGLAGALRRWLVYPAAMIWPANLVPCALLATLHREESHSNANGISRYRFFFFVFLGSFCWYWFPGFIWTGLSYFSWVCWIAPSNIVVNQLFGVISGLGMGIFTFDWAQVTYANYSPLMTPWWSEANVVAGFVIFFWILTPALYYTNQWNAQWFPISDSESYDNTGNPYNVSMIINDDLTFNVTKYEAYSQLYLPTTFAVSYCLSFASLTSVIVHTYLYYRHDIIRQFKASLVEEDDIHRKLMRVYPEVPDWWYYVLFIVAFGFSIFVVQYYPTDLTVWALIIALLLAIVWSVPIGFIQAVTNIQPGLNVITEYLCGYMLPGRPIANICFKTYGYICMAQGLAFVSDLKIGHYMKVPPRTMFWAQTVATVIGAIVQVAVTYWMLWNINGICEVDPFICPGGRVFFTASMIWGAIGPARMFGSHGIYANQQWFFLVGALAPIPIYFLTKRYPNSLWKYVNMPLIFSGTGYVPPATGINYTMWGAIGFIFQFWIRRYNFNWWSKYNYVLSAGLDCGLAISSIVIFFAVEYVQQNIDWWGNDVWINTRDATGLSANALNPPVAVPDCELPWNSPCPTTTPSA